jgi:hypothetical protein
MPEDSFVIFDVKGPKHWFVQFAVDGNGGLWGEAVSNEFLGEGEQLSPEQEDRLVGLGWHRPEALYDRGDEPVNYFREWKGRADLKDSARLAATTLRDVFGVKGTDDITVELEAHEDHEESDEITLA